MDHALWRGKVFGASLYLVESQALKVRDGHGIADLRRSELYFGGQLQQAANISIKLKTKDTLRASASYHPPHSWSIGLCDVGTTQEVMCTKTMGTHTAMSLKPEAYCPVATSLRLPCRRPWPPAPSCVPLIGMKMKRTFFPCCECVEALARTARCLPSKTVANEGNV